MTGRCFPILLNPTPSPPSPISSEFQERPTPGRLIFDYCNPFLFQRTPRNSQDQWDHDDAIDVKF